MPEGFLFIKCANFAYRRPLLTFAFQRSSQ